VLYGSHCIITATKKEDTKIYGWNEEPFVYQSEFNKTIRMESQQIFRISCSVYHEGAFNNDQGRKHHFYFSSESLKIFEKDKVKKN
jgi:hypothetical protein